MALKPGTQLGPYEITAPLGAGGMGEVYRATDTKLKREVAIKIMPDDVTGDSERLARFEREAHVLACPASLCGRSVRAGPFALNRRTLALRTRGISLPLPKQIVRKEDKMKRIGTKLGLLCAMLLLVGAPLALAEGKDKAAKKRAKIDARSSEILEQVLGESAKAKELHDKAMGYAVFDNTKAALGVSGGGGSGVAVDKAGGTRTYMKMGTAGVGFGIGIKSYQVIMLFENEKVFRNFVDKGWQADTQAGAAAGTKGAAAETTFHDGMAVFVRTKKGLMASADVSGTKYWQSDLNE